MVPGRDEMGVLMLRATLLPTTTADALKNARRQMNGTAKRRRRYTTERRCL